MGKDSWDTETGLLDDYTMVVDEAWFAVDEEDPQERVFLFLRGTAIDADGEEHEDHTERYSTGKNWEVVEDGAEVENAAGRNKFNQNAGIGRLINALVALGDDEAKFLAKRGDTFEAATYQGLNLTMKGRVVSKFTNDDGEEIEWRLNLPVSLDTSGGKKSKGKGGKGKASRSKGKKSSKGDSLRAAISEFAAQFDEDEHDEFVDQVLDEDIFDRAQDIMDDDELHAEVLDDESDLWADAH